MSSYRLHSYHISPGRRNDDHNGLPLTNMTNRRSLQAPEVVVGGGPEVRVGRNSSGAPEFVGNSLGFDQTPSDQEPVPSAARPGLSPFFGTTRRGQTQGLTELPAVQTYSNGQFVTVQIDELPPSYEQVVAQRPRQLQPSPSTSQEWPLTNLSPDITREDALNYRNYRVNSERDQLTNTRNGHTVRKRALPGSPCKWFGVGCVVAAAIVGTFLGIKFGLHPQQQQQSTNSTVVATTSFPPTATTTVWGGTTVPTTTLLSASWSSLVPVTSALVTSTSMPTSTVTQVPTPTPSYLTASYFGYAQRTNFTCSSINNICPLAGTGYYDAVGNGEVGMFITWPADNGSGIGNSSTYNATVPQWDGSQAQFQNLTLTNVDNDVSPPGCTQSTQSNVALNVDGNEASGTVMMNYAFTGATCGPYVAADCFCTYAIRLGFQQAS